MYKPEFEEHLGIFETKLNEFKENPAQRDQRFDDYCKFMAHISGVYKEQIAEYLCSEIINLLQQYYSIMNP